MTAGRLPCSPCSCPSWWPQSSSPGVGTWTPPTTPWSWWWPSWRWPPPGAGWPRSLAAVTSALAFDFFLTRPYESFRISSDQNLITEILLLVVGLAVGELAARGRAHRVDASERTSELALLHSVTELAATGSGQPGGHRDGTGRAPGTPVIEGLPLHPARPRSDGGPDHAGRATSSWVRSPGTPPISDCPPSGSTYPYAAAGGWSDTSCSRPHPGEACPPPATGRGCGHRRPGRRLAGGRPPSPGNPIMKGRPGMTRTHHPLRGSHG